MDNLSSADRSRTMATIRSRGNRSTEWRLRSALMRAGIGKWVLHPPDIPGKPDFFFPRERIAIFIDGCFWHCCPACRFPVPQTNRRYWRAKLLRNIARDREVSWQLKGWKIRHIRVWEHEMKSRILLVKQIVKLQKVLAKGIKRPLFNLPHN